MVKDKQGRSYARERELKAGDIVTVDGDFTCVMPWTQHEVKQDSEGLYIECSEGKHHLSGQQSHLDDDCIGIYKGVIEQKKTA